MGNSWHRNLFARAGYESDRWRLLTLERANGKVSKITDNYVTLEVAPNTTIQVQKQAVTTLLPKGTIKDAK